MNRFRLMGRLAIALAVCLGTGCATTKPSTVLMGVGGGTIVAGGVVIAAGATSAAGCKMFSEPCPGSMSVERHNVDAIIIGVGAGLIVLGFITGLIGARMP